MLRTLFMKGKIVAAIAVTPNTETTSMPVTDSPVIGFCQKEYRPMPISPKTKHRMWFFTGVAQR